MTDVRAILESEARLRAKRDRQYKLAAKILFGITAVSTVILMVRHPSWDTVLTNLAPMLALVGIAAGYTPGHRKALAAASVDPDPALDVYFAQTLASFDPAVFALGQEAFVQRFAHREPVLDSPEWRTVALSLLRTREKNAALMLSLLRRGAGASSIEPIEGFAGTTKTDCLRTAAHEALAEIRLRTARKVVLASSDAARREQEAEVVRLGL